MSTPTEKELRKAWLKRKFASWEYHEEMLRLHDEFLTALHRHWDRPDIQQQYPREYKVMKSPVFYNFDDVSKPGEIPRSSWRAGKTAGWARSIRYNFSRGLSEVGDPDFIYAGMDDATIESLEEIIGKALDMAKNIVRTVEDSWVSRITGNDDILLDETYTGPIDWPPNWRDEVDPRRPAPPPQYAGQACPQTGWWSSPAKRDSRRHFTQGEVFPTIPSETARGATLWQWDENQDGAPGEDKS